MNRPLSDLTVRDLVKVIEILIVIAVLVIAYLAARSSAHKVSQANRHAYCIIHECR